MSVGKDRTYWMDLSHKGASEIFDLDKELLPFVHDPENYVTENTTHSCVKPLPQG